MTLTPPQADEAPPDESGVRHFENRPYVEQWYEDVADGDLCRITLGSRLSCWFRKSPMAIVHPNRIAQVATP